MASNSINRCYFYGKKAEKTRVQNNTIWCHQQVGCQTDDLMCSLLKINSRLKNSLWNAGSTYQELVLILDCLCNLVLI